MQCLDNLTHLSIIAGNKYQELEHARLYIIFQLSTLQVLDEAQVIDSERENSKQRFLRGMNSSIFDFVAEIEELEFHLEEKEKELTNLKTQSKHSNIELSEKSKQLISASNSNAQSESKIEELLAEIDTKNLLVRAATNH